MPLPPRPAEDADGHRWSGWPGAFCFYCGREDQREIALADGVAVENIIGNPRCPMLDQEKDAVADKMNPGWRAQDAAPTHRRKRESRS